MRARLGIALQSNGRMLKFDQALINQVGLQHTGGSCLGYAAAYAKTITTGTVHTWAEFDYNGGAYGESGFYGKNTTDEFDCRVIGSESEVLRALYNAINDGHPVVRDHGKRLAALGHCHRLRGRGQPGQSLHRQLHHLRP